MKAVAFQKFMYKRKELTLICICGIINIQKENINRKLYINSEKLLFLKFQHKLQEKFVVSAKSEENFVSWTQIFSRIC